MLNAKYIVFEDDGLELPLIFSPLLTHSDVSVKFVHAKCKPISAGFVRVRPNGEVVAEGKSISLDMVSRGNTDAALIRAMLTPE